MNRRSLATALLPLVLPTWVSAQNLTVPSSITTTVGRILPERSNAGAAYLQGPKTKPPTL